MMGLHQLSPSRSFLVAYGTDDDPVERDSLGTAIGCLVHAGRLSNPRGNCQFKMNGPLRCYISESLTEPFIRGRAPPVTYSIFKAFGYLDTTGWLSISLLTLVPPVS